MDATRLLKQDHDKVKDLFERFEQAEADDQKQLLVTQIIKELQVHTSVEEDVFYPAVRKADEESAELVREGLEEHHVADQLMREIQALEVSDPQLEAKMTVLRENVEHHGEEEEGEMFPGLQQKLGKDTLEQLGDRMLQAKGAPPAGSAGLVDLTKEELYAKAQELDISGRSDMSKDELVDAIRAASV
jgi:hemerythrin superfamily protein